MSKLLLMSGGIDSACIAASCRPALCLTVDYGQAPAKAEVSASRAICASLGIAHDVVSCRIDDLGAGDLAGKAASNVSDHSEFWPFRNQFLITLGAMRAIKDGMESVLIGTVADDIRHRDGHPRFLDYMRRLLEFQEGGIVVDAPMSHLSSIELIAASQVSSDLLAWTHSCHRSSYPCGSCPGCCKRAKVIAECGGLAIV